MFCNLISLSLCVEVSGKRSTPLHGYELTVLFQYMTPTYRAQHYLHLIIYTNVTQLESKFHPINKSYISFKVWD
jgi:hypothetical protein